jgi:hypothetical protein
VKDTPESFRTPVSLKEIRTFLRYTDAYGASGRLNNTLTTVPNPANGVLASNVWGAYQGSGVLTVSACARFYPSKLSLTSAATAAGCTTAFTLP